MGVWGMFPEAQISRGRKIRGGHHCQQVQECEGCELPEAARVTLLSIEGEPDRKISEGENKQLDEANPVDRTR